ncbi:MAG: AtpZ/AtpI family protein [Bacteroidales bacterium]|nr:AtpZ/AtpI family protein [Bacteroidales bacterium]
MKKKSQNPDDNPLRTYARYSSLAFQMLAIILIGVWGGRSLDKWLELKIPVFTMVLSVVSVSLSIYYAVKDFIRKP